MDEFQVSLSGFELLEKSDRVFFEQKLEDVLSMLGLENKLLTIHLCDDQEIKGLNKKFRKKNKATDVLSFEGDDYVLGDIVISVETAKAQSEAAGHGFREELCVLFVHGLLHLLGCDHEIGDEEAMRQAEAEMFVLSGLDIPVEIALIGRHISC